MSLILRQDLDRKLTIPEMDGNFTYLDNKSSIIVDDGSSTIIIQAGLLSISDIIAGTALSGAQLLSYNSGSQSIAFQLVSTKLSGDLESSKAISISQVGDDIGLSKSIQIWDATYDRWSSSISAESLIHETRAFVKAEAGSNAANTRAEIECYDEVTQEKISFRVYQTYGELVYEGTQSNQTYIYVADKLVSLGDIYDSNNGTKIVINENTEEILFNSNTISVNGTTAFSGTYSSLDNQIVTVENGLIISVI